MIISFVNAVVDVTSIARVRRSGLRATIGLNLVTSADSMAKCYIWKFIHNAIVHGLLMSWPWEPAWVVRLHDWSAKELRGAEREVKGGE